MASSVLWKEHVMTNDIVRLPIAIGEKIVTTTKSKVAGERAVSSLVDAMVKANIPSTHLISPSAAGKNKGLSTAPSQEYYDDIRANVVLGFSASAQKLIAYPSTRGLTDAQRGMRKYWQQQIGAIVSDFKTQLAKREEAKDGGGAKPKRSDAQRIADNLNDCSKVIENSEGINGVDLLELGKLIKAAKSALHAKF